MVESSTLSSHLRMQRQELRWYNVLCGIHFLKQHHQTRGGGKRKSCLWKVYNIPFNPHIPNFITAISSEGTWCFTEVKYVVQDHKPSWFMILVESGLKEHSGRIRFERT